MADIYEVPAIYSKTFLEAISLLYTVRHKRF